MELLKKQLEQFIIDALKLDANKIELYKEEKEYAEKHDLIPEGVQVIEKDEASRFSDAYVERCEKATMALILGEIPSFLDGKITHLKEHIEEFVYVESKAFELLGIDAISLELDDVFGTYTAMFGLTMRKKFQSDIKAYLDSNLTDGEGKYSVAFSERDGLWDMNFSLNYANGFKEDMTMLEAYNLIYNIAFNLVETLEANE